MIILNDNYDPYNDELLSVNPKERISLSIDNDIFKKEKEYRDNFFKGLRLHYINTSQLRQYINQNQLTSHTINEYDYLFISNIIDNYSTSTMSKKMNQNGLLLLYLIDSYITLQSIMYNEIELLKFNIKYDPIFTYHFINIEDLGLYNNIKGIPSHVDDQYFYNLKSVLSKYMVKDVSEEDIDYYTMHVIMIMNVSIYVKQMYDHLDQYRIDNYNITNTQQREQLSQYYQSNPIKNQQKSNRIMNSVLFNEYAINHFYNYRFNTVIKLLYQWIDQFDDIIIISKENKYLYSKFFYGKDNLVDQQWLNNSYTYSDYLKDYQFNYYVIKENLYKDYITSMDLDTDNEDIEKTLFKMLQHITTQYNMFIKNLPNVFNIFITPISILNRIQNNFEFKLSLNKKEEIDKKNYSIYFKYLNYRDTNLMIKKISKMITQFSNNIVIKTPFKEIQLSKQETNYFTPTYSNRKIHNKQSIQDIEFKNNIVQLNQYNLNNLYHEIKDNINDIIDYIPVYNNYIFSENDDYRQKHTYQIESNNYYQYHDKIQVSKSIYNIDINTLIDMILSNLPIYIKQIVNFFETFTPYNERDIRHFFEDVHVQSFILQTFRQDNLFTNENLIPTLVIINSNRLNEQINIHKQISIPSIFIQEHTEEFLYPEYISSISEYIKETIIKQLNEYYHFHLDKNNPFINDILNQFKQNQFNLIEQINDKGTPISFSMGQTNNHIDSFIDDNSLRYNIKSIKEECIESIIDKQMYNWYFYHHIPQDKVIDTIVDNLHFVNHYWYIDKEDDMHINEQYYSNQIILEKVKEDKLTNNYQVQFNDSNGWIYQQAPMGTKSSNSQCNTDMFPYGTSQQQYFVKQIKDDSFSTKNIYTIYIYQDDEERIYVNGQSVNDLTDECCKWISYDITSYLHKGYNTISVYVSNGFQTGSGPGIFDCYITKRDENNNVTNVVNRDDYWYYCQILNPTSENQLSGWYYTNKIFDYLYYSKDVEYLHHNEKLPWIYLLDTHLKQVNNNYDNIKFNNILIITDKNKLNLNSGNSKQFNLKYEFNESVDIDSMNNYHIVNTNKQNYQQIKEQRIISYQNVSIKHVMDTYIQ